MGFELLGSWVQVATVGLGAPWGSWELGSGVLFLITGEVLPAGAKR